MNSHHSACILTLFYKSILTDFAPRLATTAMTKKVQLEICRKLG
jgi:hypothetical protein